MLFVLNCPFGWLCGVQHRMQKIQRQKSAVALVLSHRLGFSVVKLTSVLLTAWSQLRLLALFM